MVTPKPKAVPKSKTVKKSKTAVKPIVKSRAFVIPKVAKEEPSFKPEEKKEDEKPFPWKEEPKETEKIKEQEQSHQTTSSLNYWT